MSCLTDSIATKLVLGLDVREAGFELLLPGGVGAERVPLDDLARRVQLQQFVCDLRDGPPSPRLDLFPIGGAEPVQAWRRLARAHVTRQPVGLVDRHVELVALRILHLQIFAVDAVDWHLDQALEQPDAVFQVDDVVARLHVGEEDLGRDRAGPLWAPGLRLAPPEQLSVGQEPQAQPAELLVDPPVSRSSPCAVRP